MNNVVKKITSEEIFIGSEAPISENFFAGVDLANKMIKSMNIKGEYDYDYYDHDRQSTLLRLTITKDSKVHQFDTKDWEVYCWIDPYDFIEDCINKVDPDLKAVFRTYGNCPVDEDEVTLTIKRGR